MLTTLPPGRKSSSSNGATGFRAQTDPIRMVNISLRESIFHGLLTRVVDLAQEKYTMPQPDIEVPLYIRLVEVRITMNTGKHCCECVTLGRSFRNHCETIDLSQCGRSINLLGEVSNGAAASHVVSSLPSREVLRFPQIQSGPYGCLSAVLLKKSKPCDCRNVHAA